MFCYKILYDFLLKCSDFRVDNLSKAKVHTQVRKHIYHLETRRFNGGPKTSTHHIYHLFRTSHLFDVNF